ncbi:hypothetical protein [Desulfotalea psychrophila]|uniref:Uncharacterized protein n=1 Tax=Desulfotalea psychrophila (strain LSv54 / DSM 12343) TaxID=177439 RepID=Q6ARV8_DESPS|nr:hypothetical protein [Desulfotalea psychrophila]CAG34917.1 unknown protein [Desulfotalea psychrophila LSv54]
MGHSDIPDTADKGVFAGRIELNGAISLTRLSRYSFPDEAGTSSPERDQAGREVLIQLALLGVSLVMDKLDLRSGCELYTASRESYVLRSNGEQVAFNLPSSTAKLKEALAVAKEHGLSFNQEPICLTAGSALVGLLPRGEE